MVSGKKLCFCMWMNTITEAVRFGSGNSTTAEEVAKFQRLFPNLKMVDATKGIRAPKIHSKTHG